MKALHQNWIQSCLDMDDSPPWKVLLQLRKGAEAVIHCLSLSTFLVVRPSCLPHPWLAAPPVNDRQDPVQEHAGSLHWLLPAVQTEPGGPGAPASFTHHPAERYTADSSEIKRACVQLFLHWAHVSFALLDTVFCESSPPRSPQDKQRRAKKTFEEMMTYIPGNQSPSFQC